VTPNFHTQTDLMPFAVNGPIACGGVLVMPGDIIVADEDGAVVVPEKLAPELIKQASEHHEWETFSKVRLMEGGDLRRYYPLSDAARPEYEEWLKKQAKDSRGRKGTKGLPGARTELLSCLHSKAAADMHAFIRRQNSQAVGGRAARQIVRVDHMRYRLKAEKRRIAIG
jgi:hypothetical protein